MTKSDTFIDHVLAPLYSEQAVEAGITVEMADLINESMPYTLLPDMAKPLYADIAQRDSAFYGGLSAAGFLLDFGEDGSGLLHAL